MFVSYTAVTAAKSDSQPARPAEAEEETPADLPVSDVQFNSGGPRQEAHERAEEVAYADIRRVLTTGASRGAVQPRNCTFNSSLAHRKSSHTA